MLAFGKLAASSRLAPVIVQSITSKSHLGSLSLLSTAPALVAASKTPSRSSDHFTRFILPTTVVPSSPAPSNRVAENLVWRAALQNVQKKQKEEINNLQWMLDSLRIAQLPTNNTPTTTVVPKLPTQQQQHTFQVMNRNARKPKRANHGKRPCSRVRRRFKVKKWQNTSRRG